MKKPIVSIIIVQYKVHNLLLECISSLRKNIKDINYEIIVVDNDEIKSLKTQLLKRFPKVVYIPNKNKGFGHGNNVGVKKAKGKYLFFLNPDTTVFENTINGQVAFLDRNKKIGIVAPILLNKQRKPYKLQGFGTLTFFRAIFSLTFLNNFFPNNPISKEYWLPDWDHKKVKEVGVVPGTAFMMEKSLFEKVGGFDETFFLYFEEFDLCKRVKDLGLRVCMLPQAKVIHLWGESTKQRLDINAIFQDSRFYYFRKHFGLFKAFLIECVTRCSKEAAAISLIIIFSSLLSLWQLASNMTFIGDQAWFYLSARDFLLGESFPLVGITSSHTWLHQGPLWTYLLSIALWIGRYSPLSGAYLSVSINALTIFFFYILGKRIFSKQIALTGSLLYAFSPYIIDLSRMPYHTTPIPLLTLFYFYSLVEWMRGKRTHLPWIIFLLVLLYNFELATVILVMPLLAASLYGFLKKTPGTTQVTQREFLQMLVLGFIPLIPILIYDFIHGFKQTLGFSVWLVYTAISSFVHFLSQTGSAGSMNSILGFLLDRLHWLIFLPSQAVSIVIIVGSFGGMVLTWYQRYRKNEGNSSYLLLTIWILASVGILLFNKVPSDAYLPVVFPALFLSIAIAMVNFLPKKGIGIVIFVFILLNVASLLKHNYSMSLNKNIPLSQRVQAVNTIITASQGNPFTIQGSGTGSQFESFIMPYKYLLWYNGYFLEDDAKLKFIIKESNNKILVTQRND
jgi:GT2 family glycosyltransferase